jgi:hypothetical protein
VGVHRAVVQPGKLATPGDLEELRTVRQDERDTVGRSQPGLVQHGSHPLAVGVELAVADRLPLDDQGYRVRGRGRVVGDVHAEPL